MEKLPTPNAGKVTFSSSSSCPCPEIWLCPLDLFKVVDSFVVCVRRAEGGLSGRTSPSNSKNSRVFCHHFELESNPSCSCDEYGQGPVLRKLKPIASRPLIKFSNTASTSKKPNRKKGDIELLVSAGCLPLDRFGLTIGDDDVVSKLLGNLLRWDQRK